MKSFKLLLKFLLSLGILFLPFYMLKPNFDILNIQSNLSHWLLNPEIEIHPNELTYLISALPHIEFTIDEESSVEIVAPLIPNFENRDSTKRIYLYNTHQTELYSDGVSIYEVTIEFAQMLEKKGFEVVFESNNFITQMYNEGKEYHQLYDISRQYINEAFVNYGGFDLVIDVHRDACTREVSLLSVDGVDYARLMFVVGMNSPNAGNIWNLSTTYSDKMQHQLSGIMRETFKRESVYNQDMFSEMLLLEVGGDQNSSTEALRSLELFSTFLKEEYQ